MVLCLHSCFLHHWGGCCLAFCQSIVITGIVESLLVSGISWDTGFTMEVGWGGWGHICASFFCCCKFYKLCYCGHELWCGQVAEVCALLSLLLLGSLKFHCSGQRAGLQAPSLIFPPSCLLPVFQSTHL